MIRNTCPFYEINVTAHDIAICYDQCNKCIQITCNHLNDLDYEDLMIRNEMNLGTVKHVSKNFYHFVVQR